MLGDSGGNSGGRPWSCGNPWGREETLALIRIRSEMASAFRDVTINKGKAFLWEEVSRKLAEVGYEGRSAKKCKDKLESLHRSYNHAKRRQDGTSYRFSQALDALHAATARARPQRRQELEHFPMVGGGGAPQSHAFSAPRPMSAIPLPPPPPRFPIMPAPVSWAAAVEPPPASLQGLSFSSMSESESDDDGPEDGEMAAGTGNRPDGLGKRKRTCGGGMKKMMAFVEGLMKQVVQRQEEMHRRFLTTMEKREAERAAREEACRRQEAARLKREQEQRAHERAAAASRDASIIAFLQRVGGQAAAAQVVFPAPTPMHVQSLQTPPPPPKDRRHQLPPLQRQPPQAQAQEHEETTTQEEAQYSRWFTAPWN